jgi:hypothetical protein
MPHPLASISEKVKGIAYLLEDIDPQYDSFGNPIITENQNPIDVDIMIKRKNTPVYQRSNAVEIVVTTYQCFLIQPKSIVDIEKISPQIRLENGKLLMIIDTTQRLLKPLNKIFGQQFLATIQNN